MCKTLICSSNHKKLSGSLGQVLYIQYLDLYACVAVNCTEGALRLAGTLLQYVHYGRMEICVQNQWHSICGDTWTEYDVAVACRELGYTDHGNFA